MVSLVSCLRWICGSFGSMWGIPVALPSARLEVPSVLRFGFRGAKFGFLVARPI
jgi:hypothetical protein